ncbi:uncharacterized protein ARMOST_17457 [Armillaria ostoyae]|uniref:Uncharacterized protein n=1 Tax=Armillaria ostoyae TaxID=47428 RepID=A0A284RZ16_ARMOS|nr:uncharacterized protein ARMOST_17457 [Armillaria ostoyae]
MQAYEYSKNTLRKDSFSRAISLFWSNSITYVCHDELAALPAMGDNYVAWIGPAPDCTHQRGSLLLLVKRLVFRLALAHCITDRAERSQKELVLVIAFRLLAQDPEGCVNLETTNVAYTTIPQLRLPGPFAKVLQGVAATRWIAKDVADERVSMSSAARHGTTLLGTSIAVYPFEWRTAIQVHLTTTSSPSRTSPPSSAPQLSSTTKSETPA